MKPYTTILPTRWGNMVSLNCDSYTAVALWAYGDHCHDEVGLCLEFIKEGDVVIDAGANIGTFTVPFAQRIGPKGICYAFEPQRLPYMCLCANVIINSLAEWTTPLNLGLSDKAGVGTIPMMNPHVPNNSGGAVLNDVNNICGVASVGKVDVDVITIDSLNLGRLDFIKVDCEGMDADIIMGGQNTIARCSPPIIAEAFYLGSKEHPLALQEYQAASLEKLKNTIAAIGYNAWRVSTPLYSPFNARLSKDNVFGELISTDILALPIGREPPAAIANNERFA